MNKIEKFLKRINYQGKPNVNLESLTKLQTSFFKFVDSSYNSKFAKKLVSMLFDKKRVTLTGNKLISTFFDEESLKKRLLEEMEFEGYVLV